MDAVQLQPRYEQADRARLVRRARRLAWGGNAWHLIEFAIAVAGIAAGSIALIGFGFDSPAATTRRRTGSASGSPQ